MRNHRALVTGLALLAICSTSLSQSVSLSDIFISDSHVREDKYTMSPASQDGVVLDAAVRRRMSFEGIPYWAEYEVEFPSLGAWYAATSSLALTTSWPESDNIETAEVPVLLIDDFTDGDHESELGSLWVYRSVNPHTGVWGPIRDQYGYQLVLVQNYTHDVVSDTGAVELALQGLDASSYEGLYIVARGARETRLRVSLNSVASVSLAQLPGRWRDGISSEITTFRLPFSSFPGVDGSRLDSLLLELADKSGLSGFFIYEVGLYDGLGDVVQPVVVDGASRSAFEFRSNATNHSVNFWFVDEDGGISRYDEQLSFPLHSETRIRLAPSPVIEHGYSQIQWSAENGDPADDTFAIEQVSALEAALVSDHPNVLRVAVSPRDGSLARRATYKAILYYRDGPPMPIRGANTGRAYPHMPRDPVGIFEDLLNQITSLSYNAIGFWQGYYYSSTDYERQDYHLAPNTSWSNPAGAPVSPPDQVLGDWLDIAKARGLITMVGCSINPMVPRAESDRYHRVRIRASDGFFKLDGEPGGYASYILHMAELAEAHKVDILVIGVELTHLARAEAKSYWEDLIRQVREVFFGEVTYELLVDEYYDNRIGAWPWERTEYGIPFGILDYVGADEYRPYATTSHDSTREMYENILQGFTDTVDRLFHEPASDIARMTEAYGRPYLVTEAGMMNTDGASASVYHTNHQTPRDDEEARRAWTAYLRAMATLIDRGVDYAGLFTWGWPIIDDVSYYIPEIWGPIQHADKGVPMLFETIAAYFKDAPLEH